MAPPARVAAYWAPAAAAALAEAGARWLGRDAMTDAPRSQPALPGIAALTEEARRYGFHATLKPPFRLAEGRSWAELLDAAATLAARLPPFELPPLAVMDTHGFLALRETTPCPALHTFADTCVEALDGFRAPPDEAELARRRRAGLSAREEAMLTRWGYPYVFDTWFFHLTLTRRLDAAERNVWQLAAETHFAPTLATPQRVADLCLFTQAAPDKPFVIAARLPLGG
jgi:putative phosphonate metabolism protein